MDDNIKDVFLQVHEDAEQCGSDFAETALELFSDDETELGNFVDRLFDFYYISDNQQFINYLILLGDVYGIHISPVFETYRMDDDKTDAFISSFLDSFFYAVLATVDDAV